MKQSNHTFSLIRQWYYDIWLKTKWYKHTRHTVFILSPRRAAAVICSSKFNIDDGSKTKPLANNESKMCGEVSNDNSLQIYCWLSPPPPPQPFYGPFLGPPGWTGARRELLDFMVQGKINRGRHYDHPTGCHSIRPDALPSAQLTVSKHWRQEQCQERPIRQEQQQQSFYSPLSVTTRVSRYQKKHSPTHHPDHHPIFISFFHLPQSIASSLFKLRAWQSFCTTSLHVNSMQLSIPVCQEPTI